MKQLLLLILLCLLLPNISHSQSVCDSLEILHLGYAPFEGDSALDLVVLNNSSHPIDYPKFMITDIMGDTLSDNEVFFFGIIPGFPQAHRLTGFDGHGDTHLTGVVNFYTSFDSLLCEYDVNTSLCPDTAQMYYMVFGYGISDSGSYEWSVVDSTGTLVNGGAFSKDTITDYEQDTLWMQPGRYTLEIHAIDVSGQGMLSYHINGIMGMLGIHEKMIHDTVRVFDLYAPCIPGASVSDTTDTLDTLIGTGLGYSEAGAKISVSSQGKDIHLLTPQQDISGTVEIFDVSGRRVHQNRFSGSHTISMRGHSEGVYFVSVMARGQIFTEKVWVR